MTIYSFVRPKNSAAAVIRSKQARRIPPRRASRSVNRFPAAGVALLVGLFVGILGTATLSLYFSGTWSTGPLKSPAQSNALVDHSHGHDTEKLKKVPKKNSSLAHKKEADTPKESFEFYHLLPGMEVPIPDTDQPMGALAKSSPVTKPPMILSSTTTAPKQPLSSAQQSSKSKSSPPAKTHIKLAAARYILQAGAYRTLDSAKTLQSRLTLQGFISHVQKIEAEDGIWFRVTLGPFSTEAKALNQKNQLAKQKIHAILILQRQP